jgi:hypothetical protein
VISYPTEDYKKYIFALGKHRIERLYDLFGGLDPDLETTNDGMCSLGQLELWLYLAAFVDDDDAGNEMGWNVRDLIRGDAVSTYSDGRPVATTIRWDGGWSHMSGIPTRNIPRTDQAKSLIWKKNRGAGEG